MVGWLEGYMLQTPGSGSPTDIENKITNLIGPDSAKCSFKDMSKTLNRKILISWQNRGLIQ